MVGALASTPDAAVPRLLPGEEASLLEWGTGSQASLPPACVHELFEAQAGRTPDAVALVFGDAEMMYGELQRRAAALAAHLQGLGVGPDVLVGLMVDRGFDMIVGMLGILMAGGAYVPIDPSYPEDRIRFVLKDGGVALLVTQRAHRRSESDLCVDAFDFEASSAALYRVVMRPSQLAYMIYTSGSTGRPKGVKVGHREMLNTCLQWAKPLVASDFVMQFFSVGFDGAVIDIYPTLMIGACIVLERDLSKATIITASFCFCTCIVWPASCNLAR